MWNKISSKEDISALMDRMYSFHDSCIKEMYYISGAYTTAEKACILSTTDAHCAF